MDYRTVLVALGADAACASRIRMAADLAGSFGAHVVGVSATGLRLDPIRDFGDNAARHLDASRRRLLSQAELQRGILSETMGAHAPGVPFSHRVVEEEAGWVLAQEARVADLVVMARPVATQEVSSLAADPAEYVLLNAGRPVLLVPPAFQPLHGGHAVIAWDGQREAARAVADAMPLLLRASHVTIVAVWDVREEPQADTEPVAGLRQYLQRHGIVAGVRNVQKAGPVGSNILEAVSAVGGDMLVAGGYGHSRLRELVMGGTTRTLMRHAEVPLLLSH
ncbi:universal stress protein [Cupriavidus basilensis]|uniref:Universal stress protein n=1 Tax=Cupriavidus basilensis TaxID=68895 RepID=A0ABT6AM82_9BURK|nr:universal stress protein [Cupriavidus basilensis]MDF3833412.1 universal stress protein [Cupriavidus basilensis]